MGSLYSEVELFDVIVEGDSFQIGDMKASLACYVDSGSTRTIVSDFAAARVKTIRAPQVATFRRGAYPVRYIAMRLARRGCKPRLIEAAVSTTLIDSADIDDAQVLIGQDFLQRDRVSMRFDEQPEMHGLHCGGKAPAPRSRIVARAR
jgi:hypothetical protein